jgi:hypothetical protein
MRPAVYPADDGDTVVGRRRPGRVPLDALALRASTRVVDEQATRRA